MKKIINNKLYCTDTARNCGICSHGAPDEGHWYEEALYRKRTGEFFLYGKGNATSPYNKTQQDGTRVPAEKIVPLTVAAARRWADENLEENEHKELFGEIAQDNIRTTLSLSVSRAAAEKARCNAAKNGVSLSGYIEMLISKNC